MKRLLSLHPLLISGFLWALLVLVILLTRPLLNTIEIRLMTVAWDMHVTHDFLVPTLNFQPYTQKPPLLAWLINAGWMVFGIHRWVVSALIGIFGFGCIIWTWAIARLLWPDDHRYADQTIWFCLGAAVLQIFGTLIFYDMMLTFFALGCVYMMLQALNTNKKRYFLGLGIFLGLAGLTKGPVILLHILPLALLAPVWNTTTRSSWWSWYSKMMGSLTLGLMIGFSWAIPAALHGGHDYARWILLQQTTHRVIKAFNHQQPWWYYFELGPVLLLPWLFMPSLWSKLTLLKNIKTNLVLTFLLCWIIPVFILFTAISGKQLHYLLPVWPAFMLLLSYLYNAANKRNCSDYLAFLPFFALGTGWLILTMLSHYHPNILSSLLNDLLHHSPLYPAFYLISLSVYILSTRHIKNRVPIIAITMLSTIVVIHLAVGPAGFARFTTEPIAVAVEKNLAIFPERPVAVVTSRYQGDLNYPAHLHKPIHILPPDNPQLINAFFADHPNGLVAMNIKQSSQIKNHHILAIHPYRASHFYILFER